MTPSQHDHIIAAGAPIAIARCEPLEGDDHWRAEIRFEALEGEPREIVIDCFAHVIAEGTSYRSGIVRLANAASSEIVTLPARAWIAVVGHELRVMAATTGEALRCRLVAFGRMPEAPHPDWPALGERFDEARRRNVAAAGAAPDPRGMLS